MESAAVWMWAVLSAPAGAAYAVAAANRARFDEPAGHIGMAEGVAIVLIASCAVATAPSAYLALQIAIFSTVLAYLAAFDLRSMSVPVWPIIFFGAAGLGFALADAAALDRVIAGAAGYGAFMSLNALY